MKAIINGKIIRKDSILEDNVIIFNEKIVNIVPLEEFNKELFTKEYGVLEIIDAKGNYVSPGFIDLHIHGAGGRDTMDGDIEALKTISKAIGARGVTGYLPTTMSMSKEQIQKAFDTVKAAMNLEIDGAKILGIHMEGPFISKNYKGAQNEEYIVEPDYEYIRGYEDIIKIITLAPETDKDFAFIKKVKEKKNISLSLGHSSATYEEAVAAIYNGISRITHLFNAMTPFNHRSPGIVGAAFNSPVTCEIIADKIHVHTEIFKTLVKIKGKDKIILITDSMRAGCMKDGISELGGQKVIVKDHAARLEDGTLAGSVLTLDMAVKNIYDNTDLTLYEAVALASLNPAKDIGVDALKGSLDIGKDGDIIIFDEDFSIKQTIVEGKTVFTVQVND